MFDIDKLARLAKLAIPADEKEELTQELERMIEFAARLNPTETTTAPSAQASVLREDIPASSLDRERVLASAPGHKDGYIVLPRVVGEEA